MNLQEHSCGIETLWQYFLSTILVFVCFFFTHCEMPIHQNWNWSEKCLNGRKKGNKKSWKYPTSIPKWSFPPTFRLETQYRREEIKEIRCSSSKELKQVIWTETNWFIVCESLGFHVFHHSKTALCPVSAPHLIFFLHFLSFSKPALNLGFCLWHEAAIGLPA